MIIWLGWIGFLAILVAGIVLVVMRKGPGPEEVPAGLPSIRSASALIAIGLIGMIWWSSSQYISPTQAGVLENQTNGSLTVLNTGLHVWPFDLKMVPIITRTTKYSFSSKANGDNSLILGEKDDKAKRVLSGSVSPGNPTVYFWAKVVAVPSRDPELLKILHKRYGSGYLDGYVKNNFESALKTVQGAKQFNYLTDNRAKFEEEVRAELERRLGLETDGQPLITVSFINVMDYDYDDEVNNQLNEIVKAENEAKSAEARAKTALQDGLAKENLAKGERDATKATADGELYKRQQEALGITAVQNALASSPTYIQLEQAKRWNGALPQFYGGTSPIPFFNVPTAAPASTPTQ